jgi:hypothetical protein
MFLIIKASNFRHTLGLPESRQNLTGMAKVTAKFHTIEDNATGVYGPIRFMLWFYPCSSAVIMTHTAQSANYYRLMTPTVHQQY